MKLVDWMRLRDLTDETMASIVGVHRTTIMRITDGKQMPTWETVRKIHKITKGAVTANDFLRGPGRE